MRTEYRRNRRQYRVSTSGSIGLGVTGFVILLMNGTPSQRLWGLVSALLFGGVVHGVTRYVEEPWQGGILAYVYGAGMATVGLLQFTNDSILVAIIALATTLGVLVVSSVIARWNSSISSTIGASLGVVATGLVLYLL